MLGRKTRTQQMNSQRTQKRPDYALAARDSTMKQWMRPIRTLMPLILTLSILSPVQTRGQSNPFPFQCRLTITNPTPAIEDSFGYSVAGVGLDRIVVGAWQDDAGAIDAGVAHVFDLSGSRLLTITNPTPARYDLFGAAVAAVGMDRILIGAPHDDTGATNAGAAYLFSLNGTLLMTFTNPTPAEVGSAGERFAESLAAVGTDKVLIGAPGDASNPGATYTGAAYLFSTNGTLLRTFRHPPPADFSYGFGFSVAAVSNDRILVSVSGNNIVFLFTLDGELLATFNPPNPTYAFDFGASLAALGTDKIIIGDAFYGPPPPVLPPLGQPSGAAFLFSTNGTLQMTFTNPVTTPGDFGGLGGELLAVGTDKVLISNRSSDRGAEDAGAAYLFSTNGTVLMTFTNPAPSSYQSFFGTSLSAVGAGKVVIGANWDSTGADRAGVAYLFCLPQPSLSIARGSGPVTVSWENHALFTGFALEESPTLTGSPPPWMPVSAHLQTNATRISTTVSTPTSNTFYRLRQP